MAKSPTKQLVSAVISQFGVGSRAGLMSGCAQSQPDTAAAKAAAAPAVAGVTTSRIDAPHFVSLENVYV
jgi:hypothetical protein